MKLKGLKENVLKARRGIPDQQSQAPDPSSLIWYPDPLTDPAMSD